MEDNNMITIFITLLILLLILIAGVYYEQNKRFMVRHQKMSIHEHVTYVFLLLAVGYFLIRISLSLFNI
jgi:uncharacterized membrane protein YidH (DUF202 family)